MKPLFNITNATFIIRSVGERTESLCTELVSLVTKKDNIIIVKEHPFHLALKKSFQVGVEKQKKWTVCIDADILTLPEKISELIQIADSTTVDTFEVHSQMLDKFFGGIRVGGVKVYRTDYLKEAVKLIPEPNESLRPESFTIKKMTDKGYQQLQTNVVVGVHDFEQYYKDIYRKAITHSVKHAQYIPLLRTFWEREGKRDLDYMVLLEALQDRELYADRNVLDIQTYGKRVEEILIKLCIEEKSDINLKGFRVDNIRTILELYKPSKEYLEFIKLQKNRNKSLHNSIQDFIKLIFKNR